MSTLVPRLLPDLFKLIDIDGDGKVSLDEVCKFELSL